MKLWQWVKADDSYPVSLWEYDDVPILSRALEHQCRMSGARRRRELASVSRSEFTFLGTCCEITRGVCVSLITKQILVESTHDGETVLDIYVGQAQVMNTCDSVAPSTTTKVRRIQTFTSLYSLWCFPFESYSCIY